MHKLAGLLQVDHLGKGLDISCPSREYVSSHFSFNIFIGGALKEGYPTLFLESRALVFKPAPGDPLSSSNPNQTHLNQLIKVFRIT